MKKLLLTLAAAATVFAASAAPTQLNKVWTKQIVNAFPADKTEFSAKVAVDAAGNVIAAGAYNQDFTLGTTEMTAVGTGAYLAKYNLAGELAWAVGFEGSATVTAIETAPDGTIFVAGSYADEVVFGSVDGNSITKEGMMIDGAPTEKQNAAFIAKYASSGNILAVETFIPAMHEETAAHLDDWDGMPYLFSDGDIYFEIKQIKFDSDKLYISAVYTGLTSAVGLTFAAPYVQYAFFMYQDVPAASIFTLNTDLSAATEIAKVAYSGANNDGVESTSTCWNARFDVADGSVFAAFAATGAIAITSQNGKETVNAEGPAFIYTLFDNNGLSKNKTIAATPSSTVADNSFALVSFSGDNVVVAGRIFTSETVNETEIEHRNIFAANFDIAAFDIKDIKTYEAIDGDITYTVVSSAALLSSGEIYINTLGYYNTTKVEGEETLYRKGDFAGKVKSFVYTDNAFAPATAVADAYAVAAAGEYVAFGQIAETGADFSLYTSKLSGISDIVVEDADAPAVYYNLYGIQVANPENGIYIVRRGSKVSKVVK